MHYRAEIDGLRAIAVVPVVLFHAGFATFCGGFIGVDIFFVISGFLITSIIISEMDDGKFSLLHFYERRARRILPALFFVIAACIPFAWMWLTPNYLRDFFQSVVAVAVFSSNILFWHESGYFDIAAELKPLLHTWSLAVEEQYYIFFPLFLMMTGHLGKRRQLIMLVVFGLASLGLAQWLAYKRPTAAFFLLPTRGWEILLGAVIAFYVNKRGLPKRSIIFNNAASLVGFALIIYSIVYFDASTPFPGFYALAPTTGAGLLILFATESTLSFRILTNRLLVGIGLISYSIYLWHQPLFSLARFKFSNQLTQQQDYLLCLATLVLSIFSWRFIEKPYRNPAHLTRRRVFTTGGLGIVVFVACGLLFHFRVFKSKFELDNPQILFQQTRSEKKAKSVDCADFHVVEGKAQCKEFGHGDKLIAVWGDSHALALSRNVPENWLPADSKLIILGHSGCPPIIGVINPHGIEANCSSFNTLATYAKYIHSRAPEKVVLVGRWTTFLRGWQKKGVLQKATHFLALSTADSDTEAASQAAFLEGMKKTLRYFSDTDLYVLGQPPDLNHLDRRFVLLNQKTDRHNIDTWHAIESDMFNKLSNYSFTYINTRDYFCDTRQCDLKINMQPIYADDNHLKGLGILRVWDVIHSFIFHDSFRPQ